jgi:putative membrane protein
MRKTKDYLILILKGLGMGASDVVPGVSGGTIAFISGIYEELIDSIKSIDITAVRYLFRLKLAKFWSHINGWFLTAVFSGVLISVFSLAHLLQYLLIHYPSLVWSFFFGLVIASAIMVLGDIRKWSLSVVISTLAGTVIAWWITSASPATTTSASWFVFLSGALAICAMILPGISGSFILLLLGKYQYILGAVSELRFGVLLIFVMGAVVGLISFSNFLSWLLKNYRFPAVGLLAGFMIGSLNKIWPWKVTLETFTDSKGIEQPLVEKNVFPGISVHSDFFPALLLMLAGFFLILILMRMTKQKTAE